MALRRLFSVVRMVHGISLARRPRAGTAAAAVNGDKATVGREKPTRRVQDVHCPSRGRAPKTVMHAQTWVKFSWSYQTARARSHMYSYSSLR